jgi:polyisoprenoid-binding protein YceI
MNDILRSLGRMLVGGALVYGLIAADANASGLVYSVDQNDGSIAFSVRHFGLLSSEGRFARFTGQLHLDLVHPRDISFRFNIDAASLAMPLGPETAIVRGPEFFDVAHYPSISYTSTSVAAVADQHYAISGVLQLRGVARPQPLDALLLSRRTDKERHVETAEFTVTGRLKRSDFGMVASRAIVSDAVTLSIHLLVELPAAPDEATRALQPPRAP